MTTRWTTLGGWLLLALAGVEGVVAFWADLLIRGIGPEDDPLLPFERVALGRESGAATATLVVLAVVSLVAGIGRLRGRKQDTLLVAAHVGGAAAVFLHGSPVLACGLLLVAAGWTTVVVSSAHTRTRTSPSEWS